MYIHIILIFNGVFPRPTMFILCYFVLIFYLTYEFSFRPYPLTRLATKTLTYAFKIFKKLHPVIF